MNFTLANFTNGSGDPTEGRRRDPIDLPIQVAMTTAYVVAFVVGFLGNSLGIYIMKNKAAQKHVFHFLIINLACADLLVILLAMPRYIAYLYVRSQWFGGLLGNISCKAVHFAFGVSIGASILTILTISCDRFVAIVFPLKGRLLSRPRIVACFIWLVSALCFSFYLFSYRTQLSNGKYHCLVWWQSKEETYRVFKLLYLLLFLNLYAIPLFVLIFIYVTIIYTLWRRKVPGCNTESNKLAAEKSKRKIVKLLVALVSVFALCWLPAHFMHLYSVYKPHEFAQTPVLWPLIAFWLCQANSSVNPILYIAMNEDFRKEFIKIFKTTFCGKERNLRMRPSLSKRGGSTKKTSL